MAHLDQTVCDQCNEIIPQGRTMRMHITLKGGFLKRLFSQGYGDELDFCSWRCIGLYAEKQDDTWRNDQIARMTSNPKAAVEWPEPAPPDRLQKG